MQPLRLKSLRSERGITLIEMGIVLAIVGVLSSLAAPALGRHFRRQDARAHIQKIASVLSEARSRAVRDGNNFFVLFNTGGILGQLRIVDDDNNDWQEGPLEQARTIAWDRGSHPQVTLYGAIPGPPPANAVPEDPDGVIPASGTDFPIDLPTGLPAVGFNSRGIPVALATPNDWSTGAGSLYITDNSDVVYAVTLLPLGGVRIRAFQAGTATWL